MRKDIRLAALPEVDIRWICGGYDNVRLLRNRWPQYAVSKRNCRAVRFDIMAAKNAEDVSLFIEYGVDNEIQSDLSGNRFDFPAA